jgi:hypothetical protein
VSRTCICGVPERRAFDQRLAVMDLKIHCLDAAPPRHFESLFSVKQLFLQQLASISGGIWCSSETVPALLNLYRPFGPAKRHLDDAVHLGPFEQIRQSHLIRFG